MIILQCSTKNHSYPLPGSYQPAIGNDTCHPCPAGYYCLFNTSAPLDCPAYHYCPEGTESPTPCDNGTYTDASVFGLQRLDQCTQCPAGKGDEFNIFIASCCHGIVFKYVCRFFILDFCSKLFAISLRPFSRALNCTVISDFFVAPSPRRIAGAKSPFRPSHARY